jgi:hypothetical protein
MWRIFRPKRKEAMGGWKKLHNKNLHTYDFCFSSYVIKAIKLSKRSWPKYITSLGR